MPEKKQKRKPGNPNWQKGMRSPNPGGRKHEQLRLSDQLIADIRTAYENAGGPEYLAKMAETEPRLFMSLLNKVLPTQVSGDHTLTVVHIGQALERASERLAAYRSDLIDVTPNTENDSTKDGNTLTDNRDNPLSD